MAGQREQVIQTAERFVSRGKIQAAIREYRKVLQNNPRDTNTLNRVGDLYARIDRIDEAVELFTRIAEQYSDEGFLLKAIAIYKKIIKLDPTSLPIYEQLAELYHRQGLVNEARSQYQVLADYYDKHNDAEAALAIFQRMVDLEPANPSHRAKLADLSQRLGRVEDAIGQYKAVAEQMLSEGHLEEASQVYVRALAVESEDLGFITDAVLKLKESGQMAAAQRLLKLAIERNPKAEQVVRLLGGDDSEAAVAAITAPEGAASVDLDPPELAAPALETAPPPASAEPADAAIDLAADSGDPFGLAAEDAAEEAAAPAAELELPGVELDFDLDDDVFSFDLDDDAQPASQVLPPADLSASPAAAESAAASPAAPPADAPEMEEFELDLDEIEEVAAAAESAQPRIPVAPPSVTADAASASEAQQAIQIEELVAEAEVLVKYGLLKKAQERLERVFEHDRNHLGGLQVLLAVELEIGQQAEVLSIANRMAEIAARTGENYQWDQALARLERAGYELRAGRVQPVVGEDEEPAAEAAAAEAAPAEAAPTLAAEEATAPEPPEVAEPPAPKAPTPKPSAPKPLQDIDQIVADLAASVRKASPPVRPRAATPKSPPAPVSPAAMPPAAMPPATVPPATVPPATVTPPTQQQPPSPAASSDPGPAAAPPQATPSAEPSAPPPASLPDLDESMGWLDAAIPQEATGRDEEIFSDEQEFFDLAAELEQELNAEEGMEGSSLLGQPQEQSLEEIVEGFKRGVAENLSAEDYETHFNLGIAYREMGLLDEAIGEFQLAAKGDGRLVECASMLGLCFLDKGLPELAIKWFNRGLEVPGLTEEEMLGLMYDLGNAYLFFGAQEAAYETFVEIYGINTNYRDVVAKLEELGP
jgi:tetratricopeptide (TPR) repeat protein